MAKETTLSRLKTALTKIKNMDIGITDLESADPGEVIDAMVTIADEALAPKNSQSAMTKKVLEVTDFLAKDFKMVFATNDEIGEALNAAGILSPAGKPWSRSNVSKVMAGVKEELAKRMSDGSGVKEPAQAAAEPAVAPEAPAEVAEAPQVAEIAPEPVAEPEQSPEDSLMAELEELDDLDDVAA